MHRLDCVQPVKWQALKFTLLLPTHITISTIIITEDFSNDTGYKNFPLLV